MENLKLLRKNANLTQAEMAKVFNMSLRGYQDIESGKNETSYKNLLKFSDYFNCSIDYLLGHQTKNTVYLDSLTENQKEAISLIKTLTDRETAKVIGYIERIKETPLEDIILKHLESEE